MVVVLFVSWIPGQLSTVQEHLDILSLSIFGLMLKTWNYTTRFSFVGLIAFDMSREWPRRLSVITLSLFEKLIREQNTIRDSSFFASLANYARCKINLENFYGPLCFDSCKRTVKIKKLIKKPLTFLSLEFLIKLYPKMRTTQLISQSINWLIHSTKNSAEQIKRKRFKCSILKWSRAVSRRFKSKNIRGQTRQFHRNQNITGSKCFPFRSLSADVPLLHHAAKLLAQKY